MTRVQITHEFNFPGLDEAGSRALAKQIVEGRGLEVVGTKIVKDPDGGKVFLPKAGQPGSVIKRGGRQFEVWSEGPKGFLWIVPVERQEGDAAVYRTSKSAGWADRFHGDGTHCAPPTGLDCVHKSHQAAA